ncbi:MAG: amidohydrolase family protein, partial [Sinobacterium sp.]|nr:amidohydrolase family protein [Sinobacterium sp.]
PHAPYTVSDEALVNAHALATQYHSGMQMHVHETEHEVNTALKETGKRPLQRLNDLGLLNSQFQAVHMTCLNEHDIQLCKDSQLSVIHCPESNLKLASGFCPIQQLSDEGINVALGTDGAASNNDLDMLGEMRTASLLSKAVSGLSTSMNAQSSLQLATINGAKALGLEKITGSLREGKAADFIAIDIKELEQQPLFSALSMLTYSNISPRVSHSFVNGVCLMDNYQFTAASNLNTQSIIRNAKSWQHKIAKFGQ